MSCKQRGTSEEKTQPNLVYGIGGYNSEGMKSDNPHAGIYEADTARTLDLNGGNPACNQGGMAVVGTYDVRISSNGTKNWRAHCYETDISRSLDTGGENPDSNHGGVAVIQGADIYNGELTGEKAATLTSASGGTNTSGPKIVCLNDSEDVSGTLRAQEHGHPPIVLEGNGARPSHQGDGYAESETMYTMNATERHAVCVENHPNDSRCKISKDGKVQTLSGRMDTGGGNVPMVIEPITASKASYFMKQHDDGVAETLVATDYKDPQLCAYGLDRASFNQGQNAKYDFSIEEEKIGAQVARGPGAVCQSVVRRLTPLECERLQGFPDGWTDIGDWVDSKGKKHKGESDSPRYKALGNSIALPFWEWMAGRMVDILRADGVEQPTMASLFDGIGGFPLVHSRVGCKPIWASEIEEFPIAVTQIRFPEEVEE